MEQTEKKYEVLLITSVRRGGNIKLRFEGHKRDLTAFVYKYCARHRVMPESVYFSEVKRFGKRSAL